MHLAVGAKQIPDPANEVTYSNGTIERPEEQVLDDTDRYGIEVALQLKEKFDAEVTIISMGHLEHRKVFNKHFKWAQTKLYLLMTNP